MSDNADTPQVHANGTGSEAPASATVKFLQGGYEFLFTVRDANAHTLLTKRVPGILKVLAEQGATPAPAWGGKGGASKSNGDRKVCPVHAVEMIKNEKDGRSWYSHKAIDPETDTEFWCKGKPK